MSYLGKPSSTNEVILWDGSKFVSGSAIDGITPANPFPFRPRAEDIDTILVISGSVTGSVSVTNVSGSGAGVPYDYLSINVDSPSPFTIIKIPIIMPVSPLPDKFNVDLLLFTGANPSANFQSGLTFSDSTGDYIWEIFHDVTVAGSVRPTVKVLTVENLNVGATWDFPSSSISNALHVQASIEKVAPFATPPQVKIDIAAGGISSNGGKVFGTAWSFGPTTGSIGAGWAGKDFVSAEFFLVYPSIISGSANIFAAVEFLPHPSDSY